MRPLTCTHGAVLPRLEPRQPAPAHRGGHRWAEEVVRTRATEFLLDDRVRKLDGDDSARPPVDWLIEGAQRFADTLRAAGPDTELWTPLDHGTTSFWARRFANETVVHRADATLATGTEFVVAGDMALESVDEWMELDALPQHFEYKPQKRGLLGPGRTLAFAATDTAAAWFVDLTGDVITWRRGPAQATVTVRALLADILLGLYRRKPFEHSAIDGDRGLLDRWLDQAGFG